MQESAAERLMRAERRNTALGSAGGRAESAAPIRAWASFDTLTSVRTSFVWHHPGAIGTTVSDKIKFLSTRRLQAVGATITGTATGSSTLTIYKSGGSIGTIVIASGADYGVWSGDVEVVGRTDVLTYAWTTVGAGLTGAVVEAEVL